MLIVWKRTSESDAEWTELKQHINRYSNLDWLAKKQSETDTFLDLQIWINRTNKRFEWKPNVKKENLFLCLPP